MASLLLIHDLYPVSLEERVLEALDTVRPYMESHGGNVELAGLEDGVARLVLQGSCNGCAASRATLELAIKQALDEHAPDLAGLEVEGVTEPPIHGAAAGSALPMAAPAAAPTGFELPIVHAGTELPARRAHAARGGCRSPSRRARARARSGRSSVDGIGARCWPTSTARCSPIRTPAPPAGSHSATASCTTGCCAARRARSSSTCRGPGRAAGGEPLQLKPVPLLEAGGLRVAI